MDLIKEMVMEKVRLRIEDIKRLIKYGYLIVSKDIELILIDKEDQIERWN